MAVGGFDSFSNDLQSFDDAACRINPSPVPVADPSDVEPVHLSPPSSGDSMNYTPGSDSQFFAASGSGDLVVGKNIPGTNASTLRIHSIWKSLCRLVFKSRCTFSFFLQKLVKWPGLRSTSPTASCWPMPLPHFGVFEKDSLPLGAVDDASLVSISLQVAYLNWLYLDKPATPPSDICGFRPLSDIQKKVVARF